MNADRFDLPQKSTPDRADRHRGARLDGQIGPNAAALRSPPSRRGVALNRRLRRWFRHAGSIAGWSSRMIRRSVSAEHPELALARARPPPDRATRRKPCSERAALPPRASRRVCPASIAIDGMKVRPRPLSTICTSVCSDVPIIAAWARRSGRLQADRAWSFRQWPSSRSSMRFSSIAADIDQPPAALRRAGRRRTGDRRTAALIHVAASERRASSTQSSWPR